MKIKTKKVMEKQKLKNGGKNTVDFKWGDQVYTIPIDPVTQQVACEVKTSLWNKTIGGIIDKRYRRRGLNDTMYFLNVLKARQSPMLQGWWLALQMPFAAGVVTAPWMLFDTWYHRGLHELGIFLGYVAVWYYMNYKRSEMLRNDVLNWDFTIKNHGLQAVINEIQSF